MYVPASCSSCHLALAVHMFSFKPMYLCVAPEALLTLISHLLIKKKESSMQLINVE